MKKVVSLVLLVVLCFSLSGCSFFSHEMGNVNILSLLEKIMPNVTVVYHINDEEASVQQYSETISFGAKITPRVPYRENYIFAGWYEDSELKRYFDSKNQKVYYDCNLYARWLETEGTFKKDYSYVAFSNEEVCFGLFEDSKMNTVIKDDVLYIPIQPFLKVKNDVICWEKNSSPVESTSLFEFPYGMSSQSGEITIHNALPEGTTKYLKENYSKLLFPLSLYENLGYSVGEIGEKLGIVLNTESSYVETIQMSIDSNNILTDVTIKGDFATKEANLMVAPISDMHSSIYKTAGQISTAVRVETPNGVLVCGEMKLSYSPESLHGVREEDLRLARYNSAEDKMELCQGVQIDTAANTLSASIGSVGDYIVVDGAKWAEVWAKQQLLIREADSNKFYNVAFVLDISGSMRDSVELLKKATLEFISELYPEDFVSVVTFESSANLLMSGKYVQNITAEDLNNIQGIASTGGTNMYAGIELALQGMVGDYGDPRWASNEQIMIVLSDGETANKSQILSRVEQLANSNIRIISLALGHAADATLMEQLANKTNGIYQFVNSAADLQSVFEMLRGASIGLETDTDGDGIPDLIETTGMRDQYGSVYTTNPDSPDTDGDGYSDGEEMGALIQGDYAYFKRKSDPTVPSDFIRNGNVSLEQNKIKVAMVPTEYGVAELSFTLNYIHFEDTLLSEKVYEVPKAVNVCIQRDKCMDFLGSKKSSSGEKENDILLNERFIGRNGIGSSEQITAYLRCAKNHNKKHDVKIVVSGSNFDTFETVVSLDYKQINSEYEELLRQDYEALVKKVEKETAEKINKELDQNPIDVFDRVEQVEEVFNRYFVYTSDGLLTDDEEYAMQEAVLKYYATNHYELDIAKKDDDVAITHKVENWIYHLFGQKEVQKYTVHTENESYEVTVENSALGPVATIHNKTVTCVRSPDSVMDEMKGMQNDLEQLYQQAVKNAGKELTFLAMEVVFTDEFFEQLNDSILEYVNQKNEDIAQWLKFGYAIYDSVQHPTSYSTMRKHCDEILEQDFSPDVKKIVKDIIGRIEKMMNTLDDMGDASAQ